MSSVVSRKKALIALQKVVSISLRTSSYVPSSSALSSVRSLQSTPHGMPAMAFMQFSTTASASASAASQNDAQKETDNANPSAEQNAGQNPSVSQEEQYTDERYAENDEAMNAESAAEKSMRWLKMLGIAASIVAAVAAVIYQPWNYVNGHMLVSDLKKKGPSVLASESIVKFCEMALYYPTLRKSLAEDECVRRYMQALRVDESVMRNPDSQEAADAIAARAVACALLSIIACDPDLTKELADKSGLVPALMHAAEASWHREVSSNCLACIRPLCAYDLHRKEFFECNGLNFVARCFRATAPEVITFASEALSAVLPYVGDLIKKKQVQLDPQSVFNAVAQLGLQYAEGNEPQAAAVSFEVAELIDPTHVLILTKHAEQCIKSGELAKAKDLYQQSLKYEPDNLQTVFHYCKLLNQLRGNTVVVSEEDLNETMFAIKALDRVLHSSSYVQLTSMSTNDPESTILSPAYALLVKNCTRISANQEALKFAKEWTMRVPHDAISHYQYGRLLYKANKYNKALTELEIAKHQNPTQPETRFHLALCHWKKNEVNQAQQELDNAKRLLEEHNRAADNAFQLALATMKAEGSKPSTNTFLPNIPQRINIPGLQLLSGILLMKSNNFTAAIDDFNKYISSRPHFAQAYMYRAQCYYQLKASGPAQEDYIRMIGCWEQDIKALEVSKKEYFNTHSEANAALNTLKSLCSSTNTSDLCSRLARFNAKK